MDTMATGSNEEASYIDYETFLSPEFHAPTFANTLIHSTNDANDTPLDLSTPLSRVLFDVQEIDTHIDSLTTAQALPLLEHTSTQATASNQILETVEAQVKALQSAYTRLYADVTEKHETAEQVRLVASRLAATLRLTRTVSRCLQLGRSLETCISDAEKREGYRVLIPSTNTLLTLRHTLSNHDTDTRALNRVQAITTLKTSLLDPAERSLLSKSQQTIREFSMSSLTTSASTSTFAQAEETRARTLAALHTLYLLSPYHISDPVFFPNLLVNALTAYLQTSITSSVSALARALATLPTLVRTLLDISARCQNLLALETLLSTTTPPNHTYIPPTCAAPKTYLAPLLQALDTSSLPSYFWRSLAGQLAPRVQEIMARGGVSARTLRSQREEVGKVVREAVGRGGMVPQGVVRGKVTQKGEWEREAAVMVSAVLGPLGR